MKTLSEYLSESLLGDEEKIINTGDDKLLKQYNLSKYNKTCSNFDEAYELFSNLLGDRIKDVQELTSDKRFGTMAKYYTKDGYNVNKGSKIIKVTDKGNIRILFGMHGDNLVIQPIYYKPNSNRIIDYGTVHGAYKKFQWNQDKLVDWIYKSRDKWLIKQFFDAEK